MQTTTEYHGLLFTYADADGELLDVRLDSRAEFFAHHGEDFAERRFDAGYSTDAICEWAEAHLARAAYEHAGLRPTWTEAEQRGCSNVTGRP